MVPERRGRGRPTTFDRDAALDAAMPLFWRHGYEGTSIAMLTAALGIAPPTLYAAFGSKEGLYHAVLARYGERSAEPVPDAADQSAYRAVERYLRVAAAQLGGTRHPAGCMVGIGSLRCAPGNEAVAGMAAAARAEAFAAFARQVTAGRQRGELPADTDAEALARFYMAVVHGMSVQAVDGADAHTLDAIVDVALGAWPGRRG